VLVSRISFVLLTMSIGNIFDGDSQSTHPSDFDMLMDVNLRSAYALINYFRDLLINCKGCIVNLSCEHGSRPDPGMLGYSMVKAGVEMLTKTFAVGFADQGVRINAVAPSFVETNLYRYMSKTDQQIRNLASQEASFTPLKRRLEGMPADAEVR